MHISKNEKRNVNTSKFFIEMIQPPVALQYISSNINVCIFILREYSSKIELSCTFVGFIL